MQSIGFSASTLAHGIFGLLLFTMVTRTPEMPTSAVIDLSLLTVPGANRASTAMPVPEPTLPLPEPAVAEEVPQPEVPQEIVQLKPQKKIVKKTATPLPETVQLPAPAMEPEPKRKSPVSKAVKTEIVPQAAARPESNDTAGRMPAPAASGSAGSPLTVEERWKQEHFNFIKEAIRRNMTYPVLARKIGWQGRVLVSFIICQDGRVENLRIEKSSGIGLLDKNALDTIKRSAPFPNPPVRATIVLPIDYTLG
jgi:protein TonB